MTRNRSSKITLAALLGIAATLTLPVPAALARPATPAHATTTSTGIYRNGVYTGPNLSPAQKAKEDARNAQMAKDLAALKANTIMTQEQKQANYAALMKAYQADLLAILTSAQRKEFLAQTALAAKKQQAFTQAHQGQITELQQLTTKLAASFTPQQQQRMEEINKAATAQAQAILANSSLTDQDKQVKLATINKDAYGKTLGVMTKAQRSEMGKLQKLRDDLTKAYKVANGNG